MKNGVENLRGCANQLADNNTCNLSSCNKLNVHNYYKDLPQTVTTPDIVEIRFKNTRKAFFRNVNNLKLSEGDMVAVESSPGHDIGIVSLVGELIVEQMKRKGISVRSDLKKVYRKVKSVDIEKWESAISREDYVMLKARKIAKKLKLAMKIGDVEFQGDGTKAIFYYIADERVDFRELIKVLAEEFKIRIEMRQIGARQEAGRIGGIGSCGRELCCSSWMTDFVSVSTDSAREQEVSLNPQKLAGQCGKLKCCLNYELKNYKEAKSKFPRKINLHVKDGELYYMKSEIHKGLMWYSFAPNMSLNVVKATIERVKEVIELNKKGIHPEKLNVIDEAVTKKALDFTNVIGDESITRFDNIKTSKPKRKKFRPRKKPNTSKQNNTKQEAAKTSNSKKSTDNKPKPKANFKKKYSNKKRRFTPNKKKPIGNKDNTDNKIN